MPSAFHNHFQAVGFPMLLEQFGEPIVYFPGSGGSRSFDAIINREPPAIYDAAGEVVLPIFTIQFLDSCSTGMKPSEIDTGGDEVELIAEFGDVKNSRKAVIQMISQSNGSIQLALK